MIRSCLFLLDYWVDFNACDILSAKLLSLISLSEMITFTITADNEFYLYTDGIEVALNESERKKWKKVSRVAISSLASVIAIHAVNYETGGYAGILASAENTIVTDGSWKCTNKLKEGWKEKCFNDNSWPLAHVVGDHPSSPWNEKEDISAISSAAKWIWTVNSTLNGPEHQKIYCRKQLLQGL